MVWHLVLLKPRPDLSPELQRDLAETFARAAREIPTIRDVRIGRRLTHGAGYEARMADAADFVVNIAFDDLDGLQAYLRHPAHEPIAALFFQYLSSAVVYDFEVGGVEQLENGAFT